ncbi:MAG: hypothetical protein ACLSAF_16990 [Intestinimonas sp.]
MRTDRKNNGLEHGGHHRFCDRDSICLRRSGRRGAQRGLPLSASQFTDDGAPGGRGEGRYRDGAEPFSSYKTGVFAYDEESRTYLVEEYGQPLRTRERQGNRRGVTRTVIILQTACSATRDSLGPHYADLTSGRREDGTPAAEKLIPIH